MVTGTGWQTSAQNFTSSEPSEISMAVASSHTVAEILLSCLGKRFDKFIPQEFLPLVGDAVLCIQPLRTDCCKAAVTAAICFQAESTCSDEKRSTRVLRVLCCIMCIPFSARKHPMIELYPCCRCSDARTQTERL